MKRWRLKPNSSRGVSSSTYSSCVKWNSPGRHTRRIQRLLTAAHLPEGKTLATLDERQLPLKVRRQLAALLEGDFVKRAENVLAFGLRGAARRT